MATIIFNIPDNIVQRVINAACSVHGYTETIPDPENPGNFIPNPETKAAFTKRMVKIYMIDMVRQAETKTAAEEAVIVAQANIDQNIVIT